MRCLVAKWINKMMYSWKQSCTLFTVMDQTVNFQVHVCREKKGPGPGVGMFNLKNIPIAVLIVFDSNFMLKFIQVSIQLL